MKTREIFIATVQIAIDLSAEVETEAQAADWFSGLLSDNNEVFDWQYLKIGGQYMYPTKRLIADDYEEGELFI